MTVVANASRISSASTLTERRYNAFLRSLVAAVYDRRSECIAHLFRIDAHGAPLQCVPAQPCGGGL
jgi:hypothetical protein